LSEAGLHSFFLPGILLHAIALAIVAFFILFAASKSDGFVRVLGNLLGWILLLGALVILAAVVYGAATGQRPPWIDRFHERWMQQGGELEDQHANGAPPPQPAPH